ncbi:MAG: DUF4055 domain-containing protein [Limisphaerales bacterium]
MPVNSKHADYDANAAAWLRARDILAGEDTVKAAGERYLPKLDSQTADDYKAYRDRASFFNATGRTLDGYSGLIFRRAPFIKIPEGPSGRAPSAGAPSGGARSSLAAALGQFVNDCDMLGTSLTGYAKDLVTEVIGVGRAGTLVDWNGGGASRTSVSGPSDPGGQGENRAYVSLYQAEQIINWRVGRVNGRNVPTLIVLKEVLAHGHIADGGVGADEFAPEVVEQIRVLKLVRANGSASRASASGSSDPTAGRADAASVAFIYQVEIWQPLAQGQGAAAKKGDKAEWTLIETRTPLRLGKPLPLIPFVFHGPRNSLPSIDKLPLTDLIAVNLDHYRLDADYKHGMHYTALPTAWVSGFGKDSSLVIGSSTAWVAETPGATAGFLEFTGQGLGTFERAMDRDEKLLAVLGSRLLESQKRVGETAQAIELRQSGENSVLANIATSLSESLTQVLRWVYWWNSTEESPEALADNVVVISLNTDFTTAGMDSNELREIVAAWQAGAISQDTMLELFRRGEILPDGRSNEDEVALLGASRSASRAADVVPTNPTVGASKPQDNSQQPAQAAAAAAAAPANQPTAA